MDEAQIRLNYRNAPVKIRFGRGLMMTGCILFFLTAILYILAFVLGLSMSPQELGYDWRENASTAFEFVMYPVLALFMIFSGIGGISFVIDRGPLKKVATLTAIIMLIVILIDLALDIRQLVYNLAGTSLSPSASWAKFGLDFIAMQITGGIYFIGWFLIKDYVGD